MYEVISILFRGGAMASIANMMGIKSTPEAPKMVPAENTQAATVSEQMLRGRDLYRYANRPGTNDHEHVSVPD
jgi:hypothetical protein